MHDRIRLLIPALALCAACAPASTQCPTATTPQASSAQATAAPVAEPAAAPAAAPATPAAPAPPPDAGNFAEGQQQIVVRAAEAKYGPCPPAIPFECEMAVLEGNPQGSGLFTTRFRVQRPFLLQPHSHPRAERVTVLSGRISVGFGTTADKAAGTGFGAGDYYVNAPGAVHYVWADGPVEIQITGIGPWEVHPHKP